MNLQEIQKTWEKFWKNKLQPCNKLNRCAQKKTILTDATLVETRGSCEQEGHKYHARSWTVNGQPMSDFHCRPVDTEG